MKIGQYVSDNVVSTSNWSNFWQTFTSRGFVSDSWAFLLISCLVAEIFAITVGSCEKSVQILHVFGSPNFSGEGPQFLDLDYLIGVDSDHVVKFRGDRPRELGDPMAD